MRSHYLLPFFLVLFGTAVLQAQEGRFHFLNLNWEQKIYAFQQLDTAANSHPSIWPQQQRDFSWNGSDRRAFYSIDGEAPRGKWYRWLERKSFYEDFIEVQHEDYAFHVNPFFNFTGGRDFGDGRNTFMNTRGVQVEGRIGQKFTFIGHFMEQQARFPQYQTDYFRAKRSTMGWVMHRGFGDDGFDFPYSIGQISYQGSKFFNLSAGHGNHFIGEGYRSMFWGDHTVPYGYVRAETNVWKLRYVNLSTLMNDINRDFASPGGVYAKKFVSMHYLSWNITPRWNFQLFESIVIGSDTTGARTGFDWNFANPVILYRALEANRGFNIGNAMVGAGSSYRLYKGLKLYGQLAIDDFQFTAFRQIGEGHWLNFFAWQLGAKMSDAFGVRNLFLLAEVNQARPFMYAHRSTLTNYEHQGLPIAHPWETNFREGVVQAFYRKGRWEASARVVYGIRGVDTAGLNFGNDIRQSYQDRPDFDLGYFVGGPAQRRVFQTSLGLAYVVQPISNMRLELRYIHREETYSEAAQRANPQPTGWLSFGLRTALHWGYEDF